MDQSKQSFLKSMLPVLQMAWPEITAADYRRTHGEEYVDIRFVFPGDGSTPYRDQFSINVTADSLSGMLLDIARGCNRHL